MTSAAYDSSWGANTRTTPLLLSGVVFALLGYEAIGRVFSYIGLDVGPLPVYLGELLLFAAIVVAGVTVVRPLLVAPGGWAILGWGLVSLLHVGTIARFGPLALRDYATIYYSLFAPVAMVLAMRGARDRLLRTLALGSVIALPIASLFPLLGKLSQAHPIQVAPGVYLFGLRGDWATAQAVCGVAAVGMGLVTYRRFPRAFRGLALLLGAWVLAVAQVRAGYIAVLLVILTVGVFGQAQLAAKAFAALAYVALLGALIAPSLPIEGRRSSISVSNSISEAKSVFTARGPEGSGLGGTRSARLRAWRLEIDAARTRSDWLWFGRGFGPDLASGLKNSDPVQNRNPHSIFMTALLRTGVVGLLLFVFMNVAYLVALWRTQRRGHHREVIRWLAVFHVAVLGVASFGVVLESPFGAIPWYVAMGLGWSYIWSARHAEGVPA